MPGTAHYTAGGAPRPGDLVEVRHAGRIVSVRKVEIVMPDGLGFWLSADGADTRLYVPTGRCSESDTVSLSLRSEDMEANGSRVERVGDAGLACPVTAGD